MKKRSLIIFILAIMLLLLGLSIYMGKNKEHNKEDNDNVIVSFNKEDTIEEAPEKFLPPKEEVKEEVKEQPKENHELPKEDKNYVIVIDPGHGGGSNLEKEPIAPGSSEMKIKDGGGAEGISTNTPEYKINMRVALALKDRLQQLGYKVIMTKEEENLSLGNVDRANIANDAKADLAIRLHCDSSDSGSAKGASMLVPKGTNENTKAIAKQSENYGKTILNNYCNYVGVNNRGLIYSGDMTGFNWSKVPVVLIEMGFLSNKDEDNFLSSKEFPQKAAEGIALGIREIFSRR